MFKDDAKQRNVDEAVERPGRPRNRDGIYPHGFTLYGKTVDGWSRGTPAAMQQCSIRIWQPNNAGVWEQTDVYKTAWCFGLIPTGASPIPAETMVQIIRWKRKWYYNGGCA